MNGIISDRKLPGLTIAQDEAAMRHWLAASLSRQQCDSDQPFRGDTILAVQHEILKHVPGKRCVVAYRVHTTDGALRFIGKLYRKDRGRAIFENLQNLWQAAQTAAPDFGMPQALAYLSEVGMVLQSNVPGRPLAVLDESDDLPAAVIYTAKNLAALHGLPVHGGVERALADHLEKYCHPGPQTLKESEPELAMLVDELLAGITATAPAASTLYPVHGDLNLGQIFISGARAYFIDFDGFCRTHAALDVGNFLVTLRVHFGKQYDELRQAFLETYRAEAPAAALAGLDCYQAFAYLRRAMICFRLQAEAGWRQNLRQLLEAGLAMLQKS